MSRIPPKLEAEMTPAVKAAFLALLDRIEYLEAQLSKLTPRNSSVPPSSEHPHVEPKRKPLPGKKRKQGGQKGHKRHLRELIPSEQCTSIVTCRPKSCRRCGGSLQASECPPKRHQVWEIPPLEPTVTEYRQHRGHCACCGLTTLADLPAGVPRGQCGPRLAAFTGLLMGHFSSEQAPRVGFSE